MKLQQQIETNSSDIASLLELQELEDEEEKVKETPLFVDLNITIPKDFVFNDSSISDWYKEEKDRLEAKQAWIAGLDLLEENQVPKGKSGEEFLFQSDSLMSSLREPLQKRQVSGPLINAIQSKQITDPSRKYRETLIFGDSKTGNNLIESSSEEDEIDVLDKKEFKLFSENSLLDKKASQPPPQPKDTDGPLLGNVQKETNKPKLESGLLGQMDRMEKEWENIKKRGGYRATMMPQEMMGYPMPYPMPPYPPGVAMPPPMNPNSSQGHFPFPYYMYAPPPPTGSNSAPVVYPPMNPQGYPMMYPPFVYPGMPMYPQPMNQPMAYPMNYPYPPQPVPTPEDQDVSNTELLKQQWLENERLKKGRDNSLTQKTSIELCKIFL